MSLLVVAILNFQFSCSHKFIKEKYGCDADLYYNLEGKEKAM